MEHKSSESNLLAALVMSAMVTLPVFAQAARGDTVEKLKVSDARPRLVSSRPTTTEGRRIEPFDFTSRTVTFHDGGMMPLNSLGTYALTGDVCVKAVKAALESGVRLIDTAYFYGNEAEVGRAIRDSGVPRGEVFVITKIYPSQFGNAKQAIDEAVRKLDIGYIDLMLLHHPGAGDVNAYHAMEEAVKAGNVHHLGLSNWYIKENTQLYDFVLTEEEMRAIAALDRGEKHDWY